MKTTILLPMGLALLLLLSACTGGAATDAVADAGGEAAMVGGDNMSDDSMSDDSMADDGMAGESMTEDSMAGESMADGDMADDSMADGDMADDSMADDEMDDSGAAALPAWQTISLTDVRSGQTFALADFTGQTVFVEPMATWCTNCRRQLTNVAEARAQLGEADVVFVALSVETSLDPADLAAYTEQTGFDWTFAVASPEMIQALVATFGQSITNPPSTPHFIIRPDGSHTALVTGIEPAADLVSQLTAAGQS